MNNMIYFPFGNSFSIRICSVCIMAEFVSECHLKKLSRDLIANVLSRLDGLSLAAVTCTCTELQDVARERGLWESLCQAIWPSTACPEAKGVVPFDRFYAESRPLILHDGLSRKKGWSRGVSELRTEASATDFMSLVDVYYKGKCVLSKVIDGIPVARYGGGDQKWFADCPFELDVVKLDHDSGIPIEDDGDTSEDEEVGDLSKELEEDVRLSWVSLNKKLKRTVNVSSWKPLMVQKNWISCNNYTFLFGCVVPVDETVLPHGLAECVITATCELTKVEDDISSCLKWEEIRMTIKDISGAHLGGKKSMIVLNQALYSSRSNNQEEVEEWYQRFEKMKKELKQSRNCRETLANSFCLSVEVLIFSTFYRMFFL